MKISTKARYGVRACFILAMHEGEVQSITDLVSCTTLTQKYLEKILSMLVKDGFVTTKRGVNGGYMLARPASEISVGDIFRTLEDNLEITDCISGECHDEYCPNRNIMRKLYESMSEVLNHYSLKDMVLDNSCHGG